MQTCISLSRCPWRDFCLQAQYLKEGADPFALVVASTDPDTMYYHDAMKKPDWDRFIEDIQEELEAQINAGNFAILKRSKVPKGTTILPGVWQMKRKCHILTREVYKWKVCLFLDGSCQVFGQDCDLTYAPVSEWAVICFILILVAQASMTISASFHQILQEAQAMNILQILQ